MKNLLQIRSLTVLFLFLACSVLYSQQKNIYIVELDSSLDLSEFKQQNGFYNLDKLKLMTNSNIGKNSFRFDHFKNFLKDVNAVGVRKLLRRLPDSIKVLRSNRGIDFSVEQLQRQFVIEVTSQIDDKRKESLVKQYQSIKNIENNISISVETWPPNDPYYIYQYQFFSTTYNIDLPRAWNYTSGNSGIKVAIVDHGIDYTHPDLGNGIGQVLFVV